MRLMLRGVFSSPQILAFLAFLLYTKSIIGAKGMESYILYYANYASNLVITQQLRFAFLPFLGLFTLAFSFKQRYVIRLNSKEIG